MTLVTLNGKLCSYQFNTGGITKEGGTGRVFKGQVMASFSPDIQVGSYVAIKVMYRDMASNTGNIVRDEQAARIRIKHPNLLRMYEFVETKGRYHSICEWLDGETLDLRLSRLATQQTSLPESEIIAISDALLNALDCLHNHNPSVYHRDVKPGNIMICHNGDIKLIDFGVAKVRQDMQKSHTLIGTVLGTPNYAPPEQISGEHDLVNASSDLYAWGNTIYELFRGQPPFQGNQFEVMRMQVEKELPADIELLPEPYRSAVQKATQKVQLHRFQSVQDLRAALTEPPKVAPQPVPIDWRQWATAAFWIGLSIAVLWAVWLGYNVVHRDTLSPEEERRFNEQMKNGRSAFEIAQKEIGDRRNQLLKAACVHFSTAANIKKEDTEAKEWRKKCCGE